MPVFLLCVSFVGFAAAYYRTTKLAKAYCISLAAFAVIAVLISGVGLGVGDFNCSSGSLTCQGWQTAAMWLVIVVGIVVPPLCCGALGTFCARKHLRACHDRDVLLRPERPTPVIPVSDIDP